MDIFYFDFFLYFHNTQQVANQIGVSQEFTLDCYIYMKKQSNGMHIGQLDSCYFVVKLHWMHSASIFLYMVSCFACFHACAIMEQSAVSACYTAFPRTLLHNSHVMWNVYYYEMPFTHRKCFILDSELHLRPLHKEHYVGLKIYL